MSLCWEIYHFFHHIFSKNSNKPPQMHRPVIRIDIRRKKIVQKSAFSDHRGAVKKWLFFTHDTSRKKSFSFPCILPMNPGSHKIHSQIAIGVI